MKKFSFGVERPIKKTTSVAPFGLGSGRFCSGLGAVLSLMGDGRNGEKRFTHRFLDYPGVPNTPISFEAGWSAATRPQTVQDTRNNIRSGYCSTRFGQRARWCGHAARYAASHVRLVQFGKITSGPKVVGSVKVVFLRRCSCVYKAHFFHVCISDVPESWRLDSDPSVTLAQSRSYLRVNVLLHA